MNQTPGRSNALAEADEAIPARSDLWEISDWDRQVFRSITSTQLSEEQTQRLATPPAVYPEQTSALAIHWHPEYIPMELAMHRLMATFPNLDEHLVIPTQHNQLLAVEGLAGVEVDCFSHGFQRKVQLLLHFRESYLSRAHTLIKMLEHTFKYRSSQLEQYLDSILEPRWKHRLQEAAAATGANADLVEFVQAVVGKLRRMIREMADSTPPEMIKNKLVNDFLKAHGRDYPERMIKRALLLVKEVKQLVKKEFPLEYFYRASEVIEETRALGGGVVIPHPEQFWPILLADYDVDGYEVWNPQSQEYTEFLIQVVRRQNRSWRPGRRELLVFMGDDTHLSEKAKDPALQDADKAGREVGLQPAWDEPLMRKSLHRAGFSRERVIREYRNRLG